MISYFAVAHSTFTTKFLRRLKSQFQVIFGQYFFSLNVDTSPCKWKVEYFLLPLLLLRKNFTSLASAWFVIRYFSFVEQTVLVDFPDYFFVTTKSPIFFSFDCRLLLLNTSSMISSLIFLNKSFLHLDIDSVS